MRLWHKDLIQVLPDKQLIGQWRECCAIARNIVVKGTPNHMLVNKVLDYPTNHFYTYTEMVFTECAKRGFKLNWDRYAQWMFVNNTVKRVDPDDLFGDWHNRRYLNQCVCNLQEKFDCGGISYVDWCNIKEIYIMR